MTDPVTPFVRNPYDAKVVEQLLEQLLRWREETDPLGGELSSVGKDQKAFGALLIVGTLVQIVADWALEHMTGVALDGLETMPPNPGVSNLSEYQQALKHVDDHRHEMQGRAFDIYSSSSQCDPASARRLLIACLSAHSGGLPRSVSQMLVDALQALEYGDVHPLLQPSKEGRKVRWREQKFQLKALQFIAYRVGRGKTKTRAMSEVADAYGVSEHTLKSWESRLRKELGTLRIERDVAKARGMATLEEEASYRRRQGETVTFSDDGDKSYGETALL